MFLSSHILSEVEALCDRVGILRDGRLVDAGHAGRAAAPERADGRGHVRRAGAGAAAAAGRARSSAAGPSALRFEVTGAIGPLIAALAGHPVATLTSREPSLEEIFLHHYDGSDGASAAS